MAALNAPSVVIVAHTSRAEWANQLAHQTSATHICWDDGELGCYRNHLQAWRWHNAHTYNRWAVVIEDDALPVDDFPHQLNMALAATPSAITIASLYLGKARPPQHQINVAAAVSDAIDSDHAWIITDPPRLISAVGVALRTGFVGAMAAHLARTPQLDIDEAITEWAGVRHMIGYTMPSLLDHRDTPSIAAHRDNQPRLPGRKAWRIGGRDNWKTPVTVMPLP